MLSVLNELETIAPVVAIQGNVEYEEVIAKLPVKRENTVGHYMIGIVHILGDSHNRVKVARQEFPNARVVVYAHRRQQPRCKALPVVTRHLQTAVGLPA